MTYLIEGIDAPPESVAQSLFPSQLPEIVNRFMIGDASSFMQDVMPKDVVDLTITSPPYDNLRDYNGYNFDAKAMFEGLHRVTKDGGVVVWVVGDKINGGRTLSSFDHAFIGRDAGFVVHDVMIYRKKNTPFMRSNAYTNCYELMLVFSKGKPKTFNPLKAPTKRNGVEMCVANKRPDGVNRKVPVELKKEKTLTNIWEYAVGSGGSTRDKIAFEHPAIFPEKLAADHIASWSNPDDLVFDPMCGSGTTCKMASLAGRRWFGIDISEEYIKIAEERMRMCS